MKNINEFCKKHNLILLEDNCESMDAELNGKKAGTFGDLNTFSFFFSHHISTMEGGMILTDSNRCSSLIGVVEDSKFARSPWSASDAICVP